MIKYTLDELTYNPKEMEQMMVIPGLQLRVDAAGAKP
tara:strand:- start:15120 stop:15230 length:111 start_codon:yes stop_codon:yes gene_type:complete